MALTGFCTSHRQRRCLFVSLFVQQKALLVGHGVFLGAKGGLVLHPRRHSVSPQDNGQAGFLAGRRGLGFLSAGFLRGEEHAGPRLIVPEGPRAEGTEAELSSQCCCAVGIKSFSDPESCVFLQQPGSWQATRGLCAGDAVCSPTVLGHSVILPGLCPPHPRSLGHSGVLPSLTPVAAQHCLVSLSCHPLDQSPTVGNIGYFRCFHYLCSAAVSSR